VLIDFDETAGSDLVEHQPIGVDEEVVLRPGNAGADMSEDQIAPAIQGDQPVAGGEVLAELPFLLADLGLH